MWLRETGLCVYSGTRNSGWLRGPRVSSDSGIPEFRWLRELRVLGESCNREFRVIPGTQSSGWLREPRFRAFPGTRSSWRHREHGVPCDFGNQYFRRTPEKRICLWLQETGRVRDSLNAVFPGDSGNTGYCRMTPGTRSSWCLRKPGVLVVTPGTRNPSDDSANTESPGWLREHWFIQVTPGIQSPMFDHGNRSPCDYRKTESSRLLREPGDPEDSANPEFRLNPETWVPGYSGNAFLWTPGARYFW